MVCQSGQFPDTKGRKNYVKEQNEENVAAVLLVVYIVVLVDVN